MVLCKYIVNFLFAVDPNYLGFCICEFAYSLKFISNPQINPHGAFTAIPECGQSGGNFESPDAPVPAEAERGMLRLLVSVLVTVNRALFSVYPVLWFSHFCAFGGDFIV